MLIDQTLNKVMIGKTEGLSTCLCVNQIPVFGTFEFKAKYSGTESAAYIGVAHEKI